MSAELIYQIVALLLLIGLLIFGFVIPDSIRKKKRKQELDSIVPGDYIVTQQGIHGKVQAVDEELLIITCEPDDVRLQIAKWGVRNKK